MPQLRINFTHSDIARTRLKVEADLFWEAVASTRILRREGGVFFDGWRRHARELLGRDPVVRSAVRAFAAVAPDTPVRPDDAADRAGLLRRAQGAMRTYVAELVEPYRQTIEGALRVEHASRIQDYLDHGFEGLLAGFEPVMTWRPPVLTVDHPVDRDLHLDGAGLLLVPCYFCPDTPIAPADPGVRPVLVLPVRPTSRLRVDDRRGDRLGALLGVTRADILRSALKGGTTSRLAELNNVTPATVSHHTGVLREAGLIATSRRATTAVHHVTSLGLRLLTER